MGVTIHYSLRLETRSAAVAERAVTAVHVAAKRLARKRGLGEVSPVLPLEETFLHATRCAVARGPFGEAHLLEVEPEAGWSFTVDVGEGCEPATFGLGRYPAFVVDGPQRRRTGFGGAWTFGAFCKTQYASRGGGEHLLRCHAAVIDLILLWRKVGATVEISDEGEYWPGRDPRTLLRRTRALDQFTAALAGAMKDEAEAHGGPPVQSPIFAHPHFEHLEAEGAAMHGKLIEAVRRGGGMREEKG
ncbi:MAG: hypothetical protein QM691_06545 [Opitutaceae bacterium]